MSRVVTINILDYHLSKECQFLLVKCTIADCDEMIKRKDIDKHLENCKFKEISCTRCNEKIRMHFTNEKLEQDDNDSMIKLDESLKYDLSSHDCVTTLSKKIRILNQDMEKVSKKNEIYEKEIQNLKERSNLLMSNIAYKCDLAHPLIFKATWTSTCSCCGLIKICTRWECTSCKKNYCLDCIRLLNSVFCPNFHTFLYGDRGNFLCDICGAKKTSGGALSLHDPVCDFDLCDNCVMKLFPNMK